MMFAQMEISTKSEQTEVPQVTKDTYAVQAVDNQAGIVVDGPMEDAEEQHDSTEGEPSVIICSFCNEGPSGCALCEPVGKAEVTENGAPTESEFVLEPEHVAEHGTSIAHWHLETLLTLPRKSFSRTCWLWWLQRAKSYS